MSFSLLFFLMWALVTMGVTFDTTFIVSHKLGNVVYSLSLDYRPFFNFFISVLTQFLFNGKFFRFQKFVRVLLFLLFWYQALIHGDLIAYRELFNFFLFIDTYFVFKFVVNYGDSLLSTEEKDTLCLCDMFYKYLLDSFGL